MSRLNSNPNTVGGFARVVPRPQATRSAAQYALASINTPILDGHPAGRAFNVAARPPLISLPPRANTGAFPYPGLGAFGSYGNSIGSNYSPRDIAHANSDEDNGVSLSSSASEEGEEDLEKIKELIKAEKKATEEIKNLETQRDEASGNEEKEQELTEKIDKLTKAKEELSQKIEEAINELKEKTGSEDSLDEIKKKIETGDYGEILEQLNKLDPETRKKLKDLIELNHSVLDEYKDLLGIDGEEKAEPLSNTAHASLNSSASAYDETLNPSERAEEYLDLFT